MTYLAREMARDGEGATKLMTVAVRGARAKADAIKAAQSWCREPFRERGLGDTPPQNRLDLVWVE